VRERLRADATPCAVLDGDDVRRTFVPSPGYTARERDAFYASLAGLAALLAGQGLVVLVPATAHARAFRERARRMAPRFCEVHVATPLADCQARDEKGLYARAASQLPGAGVPYEAPSAPEVVANGGGDAAAVDAVVAWIVAPTRD
jgi:adenylylsulfate kinase